ncbi:hypothetical protein MN608_05296 [Microdochium nivale]|nr:hypothetical protein MN608_05296 [Microdochium nivale]
MPGYKVPRTRPLYYIDESAMNKGHSEYRAPTTPVESKPEPFVFRTRDMVRRDSEASHASSDQASNDGVTSP